MFDKERELKMIRFSSVVADSSESYTSSIKKEKMHAKSLKIQRSTKASISEFLKSDDLIINLVI